MFAYWKDNPPAQLSLATLEKMVAKKWGFARRTESVGQPIEEASQYLPVGAVNDAEWSALMKENGLPDE